MNAFQLLTLQVNSASLIGLPDGWVPAFIARLERHSYAQYFAIVAPRRSIPTKAVAAILTDAYAVLFKDCERVLEVCLVNCCRLSEKGGGIATFDMGRITVVFGPSEGWFDEIHIPKADILFSL